MLWTLWYGKQTAFLWRAVYTENLLKERKLQNDNGKIRHDTNNCTYSHTDTHKHTHTVSLNICGTYRL